VDGARIDGTAVAVALTLAIMFVAGRWDDRRGDERPRGFKGHLSSARSGRVTGGIVKLAAGAVAGAVAGAAVADGWAILEVAVLVALSANFVNLLDRAPGRAGKVSITVALGLAIFGAAAWTIAASATVGAAVACLWPDLRERAMLGDAGANPLGAVVGLGLGMSLTSSWRIVAIGVLASLNLASERWSYSAAIDRTPWLRSLDRLGRK
jgi:UDP-N-acetylmuramyl pentapeptide phosphotransferase/UDP-N-acetylglucosamine-1-phosphate transferase